MATSPPTAIATNFVVLSLTDFKIRARASSEGADAPSAPRKATEGIAFDVEIRCPHLICICVCVYAVTGSNHRKKAKARLYRKHGLEGQRNLNTTSVF